jgi:PD-(D/E)XK nuclease superfamily protein
LFGSLFDVVHTKVIGSTTEAVVLAEFLKAGYRVLLPFGEDHRYDLVIEAGGHFLRVQCKTASPCGNGDRSCVRFHAYSHRFTGGKFSGREAYAGQADLFAAYSPDTQQVYVLPVDEVPETDVWLRLTPARNGQRTGVRMAEDHTLAAWAAKQDS